MGLGPESVMTRRCAVRARQVRSLAASAHRCMSGRPSGRRYLGMRFTTFTSPVEYVEAWRLRPALAAAQASRTPPTTRSTTPTTQGREAFDRRCSTQRPTRGLTASSSPPRSPGRSPSRTRHCPRSRTSDSRPGESVPLNQRRVPTAGLFFLTYSYGLRPGHNLRADDHGGQGEQGCGDLCQRSDWPRA